MELVFITEARFELLPDGKVYSNGPFGEDILKRYLSVFDSIIVVGRLFKNLNGFSNDLNVVESDNIKFHAIEPFDGPSEFLFKSKIVIRQIEAVISKNRSNIFRVPGILGFLASWICLKRNISYALEVVGDPYEVFSPGGVKHVLSPFLRYVFSYILKYVVKKANCILYVTKFSLQRRYPFTGYQIYASNVKLLENHYIDLSLLSHTNNFFVFKLIAVGSLSQLYKAPDLAIKAINILRKKGYNVELKWLGEGVFLEPMKNLAHKLGISDFIHFTGNVNSQTVRRYLDESDLFLQISRTEGLPRALVEAMARGKVCVGTLVGGIPELLEESVLIKKDNLNQLVNIIEKIILDPEFRKEQSLRNFEEAKKLFRCTFDEEKNRVL